MESFDINRVHWEIDKFEKWDVTQSPGNLAASGLGNDEILLVVERYDKRWAFWLQEVVYHHIIQGERDGEPYMITFCGLCNAGVGMTPVIDGRLLHFRETGLYNGQQIFTDDETGSLWNHLTGEGLHGAYAGKLLDVWPVKMTTVAEEMKIDPQLDLYRSGRHRLKQKLMQFVIRHVLERRMPRFFNKSLGKMDERLPKLTLGMAIKHEGEMRFFPRELFRDSEFYYQWGLRTLRIVDHKQVPYAEWEDGELPFQLFTRWYAFSLTYPQGILVESNPMRSLI